MEREKVLLINARSSLIQDNKGLKRELVRVERHRAEIEAKMSSKLNFDLHERSFSKYVLKFLMTLHLRSPP